MQYHDHLFFTTNPSYSGGVQINQESQKEDNCIKNIIRLRTVHYCPTFLAEQILPANLTSMQNNKAKRAKPVFQSSQILRSLTSITPITTKMIDSVMELKGKTMDFNSLPRVGSSREVPYFLNLCLQSALGLPLSKTSIEEIQVGFLQLLTLAVGQQKI